MILGYGQIGLFNFYTKQYLVFITNWNGYELGDTLFLEKNYSPQRPKPKKVLKELKRVNRSIWRCVPMSIMLGNLSQEMERELV